MEQSRVPIAKNGIQAKLNARYSVLGAANPVYGKMLTTCLILLVLVINLALAFPSDSQHSLEQNIMQKILDEFDKTTTTSEPTSEYFNKQCYYFRFILVLLGLILTCLVLFLIKIFFPKFRIVPCVGDFLYFMLNRRNTDAKVDEERDPLINTAEDFADAMMYSVRKNIEEDEKSIYLNHQKKEQQKNIASPISSSRADILLMEPNIQSEEEPPYCPVPSSSAEADMNSKEPLESNKHDLLDITQIVESERKPIVVMADPTILKEKLGKKIKFPKPFSKRHKN